MIIHKDNAVKKNYINKLFWKIISQLNNLIVYFIIINTKFKNFWDI